MTKDELICKLSERVKDEFNDVVTYSKLSKFAAAYGLEGPAQILKDIAHEEHLHAEHLENILSQLGVLKEDDFDLKQNARKAVESV